MQILVTPEDIIKRCLWNDFEYYILKDKNKEQITKIIAENSEFKINEESALVIGLLKVLETPNLVHRLKQQINNQLVLKTVKYEAKQYIGKQNIITFVEKFKSNFPATYTSQDRAFNKGMDEVFIFCDKLLDDLKNLPSYTITIKDLSYNCFMVAAVKKLIDPKAKHKED